MNKCRGPKIPPLLVNNVFILNCSEKARIFNDFLSNQCRLITNSSILPTFNFLTDKRIDQISIRRDEIVSLVRTPIRHLVPTEYLAKCCFCVTTRLSYHSKLSLKIPTCLPLPILSLEVANVIPVFKKMISN